jgi:hypothetical protein
MTIAGGAMSQKTTATPILVFAMIVGVVRTVGTEGGQTFMAVGDTASLVAAVANPANEGMTIVLAPGVYFLERELELQPNMQLVGANRYQDNDGDGVWDARDAAGTVFAEPASETVLDASRVSPGFMQLYDCQGAMHASSLRPPLVRMTAGNVVRSLTVRGAKGPAIAPTIDAGHVQGDGVDFQVTDTIFVDNFIGVGAIHNDCTFAGAHSHATVERNVFLNSGGVGIFFNNVLAPGARWRGVVRNNRSTGAVSAAMSLNAGGSACDDAEISVQSAGNVFERNGLGVLVQGGRDFSSAAPDLSDGGSANRVEWTSHGDAIWNNVRRGGILANGSTGSNLAEASNDNYVRLTLLETRFVRPGSLPAEANRFGAGRRDVTLSGSGTVGTGNEVRVLLRRASSDAAVGSFVITPTPNNAVSVIGSNVAFVRANDDVWLPEAP